ncbi:hypothetical protein FZW96_14060 [Bacillus sp. BGMRC 2118]|nr:hypothetical protein FZW96_14060 [Bacillus sp. BGMRC 2118]
MLKMKIGSLFFEERKRESSLPFKIIRQMYIPLIVVILILSVGFGIHFFIHSALLLGAVSSFIDGIEGYLLKDTKKRMITDFGMSLLFVVIIFL